MVMPPQISIVDLTASDPPTPAMSTPHPTMPINVLLRNTINRTGKYRLRVVLLTICAKSQEASKIAEDLFLVFAENVKNKVVEKDNNSDDNSEDDDEDEDSSSSDEDQGPEDASVQGRGILVSTGQGLKRLRSRFATCKTCNEEFDVETNGKESCIWHPGTVLYPPIVSSTCFTCRVVIAYHTPGDSEVDDNAECWGDYEIWREGCPKEERFDDMPEGFVFHCCEREGTSGGCKIGTHVEGSSSSKRARY